MAYQTDNLCAMQHAMQKGLCPFISVATLYKLLIIDNGNSFLFYIHSGNYV